MAHFLEKTGLSLKKKLRTYIKCLSVFKNSKNYNLKKCIVKL